jgi:DNA replication protein DnaC
MRYAESNIPVEYWPLEMDSNFEGFPGLKKKYDELAVDPHATYDKGVSVCFAGSFGVGKTMSCCCLLKRAAQAGYSCLYVTLGDVVSLVASAPVEEKYIGRKELMGVEYLVLDELDPRWWASDAAAELYGRTLEDVFRARLQNKLPTFICTNHPKVNDLFTGALKKSLNSLMNKMEIFSVLGVDFRTRKSDKPAGEDK